jgi:hypothetical protein
MSAAAPAPRRTLIDRIAAIDDGAILRVAFYGLLAGCLSMLWVDYSELSKADAMAFVPGGEPVLPAFDPDSPMPPAGPAVTTDRELLDNPLTVTLTTGGVLALTGTIDPGAFERFKAEVDARGEYIQTVALNSPGGAVQQAIDIGTLIREKGYGTSVAAGALCASSCPLMLASGVTRAVDPAAAVGVHQMYATFLPGELPRGVEAAGMAMSDAQRSIAIVTRHLTAMGVDPAVWLHALETPPDRLYYLSPEEMEKYRLSTDPSATAGVEAETAAATS